jgi:phage FluMu gp28-like protein
MEIRIVAPRLTNYQKKIIDSAARFTITEAATKCGKTFSHIYWLFREAHKGQYGNNYWWVAPVFGQAEIAFNRMKKLVRSNPLYLINLTKLTITTPLGTIIQFKTAQDPDNLYGEDVYAAVFDEFTRAKEEAWHALRSTLTATRGKCKLIGNAKGKKNWGYKLGAKARAGEPGYEYHRITAYDAVDAGILDLDEVEQAKRDLPELVFKELYLAEPNEDGSNPFGIEHIGSCFKNSTRGTTIAHGVDLAKSVDWTVNIGLDGNGHVSYFERWQSSWGDTTERLKVSLKGKKAAIDSTGVGDPIVEELQRSLSDIEGVKFSSQSKQQLMEGLASAIQQGKISFDNETLREELESYEYVYTRTGVKYSAPAGMHDDTVCALALAWSKHNDKLTHIKRHKPLGYSVDRK